MTVYNAVLLVHILALLAAVATASLVHYAGARRLRAATVFDALHWHHVVEGVERILPIATLTLVASGAWMVHSRGLAWNLGWVDAGLVGAAVLMVCGASIGIRQKRAVGALQKLASTGSPVPPVDGAAYVLSWTNTCVAIGVVCVMVLKPGLGVSVGLLALGALCGVLIARRHLPSVDSERASTRAAAA